MNKLNVSDLEKKKELDIIYSYYAFFYKEVNKLTKWIVILFIRTDKVFFSNNIEYLNVD